MNKVDQVHHLTGYLSEDYSYLILEHPNIMKRLLINLKGERLQIDIQILRYQRSTAQNNYMWGVVVVCVRAWFKETTGELLTPDEVYTWLRISVLGNKAEVKEIMGQTVITMTGKRFSKMDTREFSEAVNKIITEMDSRGCFIPLPKDKTLNLVSDFI